MCSGTTLCQLNTESQFNQFSLDDVADTLADQVEGTQEELTELLHDVIAEIAEEEEDALNDAHS